MSQSLYLSSSRKPMKRLDKRHRTKYKLTNKIMKKLQNESYLLNLSFDSPKAMTEG